jgi:hypothetical protein
VTAMKAASLWIAVALTMAGCSSTVVTPDGSSAQYRWARGDVTGTLPAPLPEVEAATRTAFEELNLVGVDGGVRGLKGELTARTGVGTKVRVKLEALDFDNTSVTIRVGQVGDKSVSLQLYRHIEEAL